MDTNPFAVSPNTVQQQPQQTPSYLKQDPAASGHWMGGVSNMVKALMDGYANRPKQVANADRPVGPPLSLSPPAPVNPTSMTPPVSNVRAAPQPASPFDVGASPIQPSPIPYDPTATRNPMPQVGGLPGMPSAVGNVDPSMRGLFSQIPGEYGG